MVGSQQPAIQETVKIFPFCFVDQICFSSDYNAMYNQYSIFALDQYRKFFGFVAFRERFKARKDAFFQFHLDQQSQADQEILQRLSVTINKITDVCFKTCIETNYKIFTTEEESCVKECVQKYFKGYEELGFYTYRQLLK